jgi:hypothetical protein
MSLAQVNLLSAAVARRTAAEDLRSLRNLSAVVTSAFATEGPGKAILPKLLADLADQL